LLSDRGTQGILIESCRKAQEDPGAAFAIGRSQQIIYHMAELTTAGAIPPMPIYLDSPMAIEASLAYERHKRIVRCPSSASSRHSYS